MSLISRIKFSVPKKPSFIKKQLNLKKKKKKKKI